MKMIEEFLPTKAEERMTEINAWVQAAPQRYAVEYYGSFNAFIQNLEALLTAANAEAGTEAGQQDVLIRAKLNYIAAIYRDCRYSLMHRGRLQELGIHNMYREAYELGRFAKNAEKL